MRPHRGCSTCSAVVDEVAAMAAYGVAPFGFLFLRGFASELARLSGHIRMPHAIARVAEAVAAALVTGAMAFPAPIVAPSVAAQTIPVTGGREADLHTTSSRNALGTQAGASRVTHSAIQRVTQSDGSGDNAVVPDDELALLGVPLAVRDALNVSADPGFDIRMFEIGTVADESGKASGLLLRLSMAGAVPGTSTYEIHWAFEQQGCTGWAGLDRSGTQAMRFEDGLLHVDCYDAYDDEGSLGTYDGSPPPPSEPSAADIHIRPVVRGNVVEIEIPFSELTGPARLIHPGARLLDVYAITALAGTVQDRAPDGDRTVSYTIEK
ncbi:MAG: hypothetical protein LC750_02280 [Actinobacteria bacterium]|nr:hypothetical protein [Actinomycetota bacterium]